MNVSTRAFNSQDRQRNVEQSSLLAVSMERTSLRLTHSVRASAIRRDRQAPTARFVGRNITTAGGNEFRFNVVYRDNTVLNRRSIGNRNLMVRGAGFNQLASLVRTQLNRAGNVAIATYRIRARGGSWDAADNGRFRIFSRPLQVSDANRNFMRSNALLGSFTVNIPAAVPAPSPAPIPVPSPVQVVPVPSPIGVPVPVPVPGSSPTPTPVSVVAPTAIFSNLNFNSSGQYTFEVRYSDDTGILVNSIDDSDIRIQGPNGYSDLAIVVGASRTGTSRSVTYRINAPGSFWDASDSGTYTVLMEPNQVSDTGSPAAFVPAGPLGTFTLNTGTIAPPIAKLGTAPVPIISVGQSDPSSYTFSVNYRDFGGQIDLSTIGSGDIRVTGPGSFNQPAALQSSPVLETDGSITATYRITAPTAEGRYTIALQGNEVSDTEGNFALAEELGRFQVGTSSIRIEAEWMNLNGYVIESNGTASNNSLIRVDGSIASGTATSTFSGEAGQYDIFLGFYDESDGVGSITASVGSSSATFTLNESTGSTSANAATFRRRFIGTNVALTAGTRITIQGSRADGEASRVDYVEFVRV